MTPYVHGVGTLEITACETVDSGMFRCYATNSLGSDATTCLVHVEGRSIFFAMKSLFFFY